jgi:hypothetical protein
MKKLLLPTAMALLLAASSALAQLGGTPPFNTDLHLTVGPEAAFRVDTTTTNLTTSATNFTNYTGTTSFTYWIRTSTSGGSGTISLKVTSDFTPGGGPSVATPPTSGDALTYVPTVASPGTPASGSQTASTSAATAVATFGANAHATASTANSVAWTLTNDPVYPTGTYDATVTFTISAA